MPDLLLYQNQNCRSELFGLPTDDFWKLFLRVHDRNDCRVAFGADLERELILAHSRVYQAVAMGKYGTREWHNSRCNHHTARIQVERVHWDYSGKQGTHTVDFQDDTGKILARSNWSGYACQYGKLRKRCAKYFGVDIDMLENLPKPSQNKGNRQAYFLNRKPRTTHIRNVS